MNRRAALFAVPFALAFPLGALAARIARDRAPAAIAFALAQPLPVVDTWGRFGTICFALLAATVAFAALSLAALERELVRTGGAKIGAPLALLAAIALAGAAAWPFVFSSDVYAYAAYGEAAARGADPYLLAPASLHGPSIDAARIQWRGAYPVCVYGPAFVAAARWAWSASERLGPGAPLALLRAASALAFLASIPLAAAALAGAGARDRRATRILVWYALNPVSLWAAAEGHNDAFVLLAGAVALLAASRGRAAFAGALLGLSAALKGTGALFAAAFAAGAPTERGGRRAAAGAAAGIAAAAAIAVPPLVPALRHVGTHGRYAPAVSLQAVTGAAPALAIGAMCAVWGVTRIVRRERDGFAWIGIALVAALPNPYPWYALWLVPLALAGWPATASRALYGVTIFSIMRYLPDAAGNLTGGALRIASLGTILPLALVLSDLFRKKAAAPS